MVINLKTITLTILGFIFLGFGAIGIAIPVWPTTPFVLLSFACFSSSPKIRNKILKIYFFREHIENYQSGSGLSNKTFLISLTWLWSMLIISMFLINVLWIRIMLLLIGIAVTIHLIWMKRRKNGG